jgi:homoserine O-acetyltransferase
MKTTITTVGLKRLAVATLFACGIVHAQSTVPVMQPTEGDFEARDFHFQSGQTLPTVKLHYATLGTPTRGADGKVNNAVLLLHGTTGTGRAYLTPLMQKELFAAGQPLDASRYYIIMPDGIGRGGSSKPSDALRANFPRYGYNDVVEGHYRLLTEGLKVDHLRLVLGTSMGGMQTWVWGERHPDMMDALMPIASQPVAMSGRNWLWRRMLIDAIRNDPERRQLYAAAHALDPHHAGICPDDAKRSHVAEGRPYARPGQPVRRQDRGGQPRRGRQ